MKKKIFVISCIILVMLVTFPSYTSQEIVHPTTLKSISPAHVVIDSGSPLFFIGYHFIAGFGNCLVISVYLKTTGHAEINKLFHPLDRIVLDGNGIILLIGFIGYLKIVDNSLKLNGVAILAVCS